MRARINKVAFIGLRNLDYEELHLDAEVLTGLIGPTGAGKSTLAMCLCYALLPDRKILDIHPISEVQDSHVVGIDFMTGIINPAYKHAYVVLDITTRLGARLIAGIHISIKDGLVDFKRWTIKNAPLEVSLQDVMRVEEGDNEFYPDLTDLSQNLAHRSDNPMDLEIQKRVSDYGKELYDAGIIPTDLLNNTERSLYAKLIETSFKGGLSHEVSGNLKEYLLPPVKRIPEIVTKLQECTDQVLKTSRAIKDANEQLNILESVWKNGKEIVINALGRISFKLDSHKETLTNLQRRLAEDQKAEDALSEKPEQLEKEISIAEETAEKLLSAEKTTLELLNIEVGELQVAFSAAKKVEEDAYAALKKFSDARKLWKELAGDYSDQTLEWVTEWYKDSIEIENRNIYAGEEAITTLKAEKSGLERSASNIKDDTLVSMTGGETLGEAFKDLSEEEATAIELGLGGVTSGVVGCTPESLEDIEADESLPEVFWIGDVKPTTPTVAQSGDWYYSPRLDGGFTVFSKNRMPIFGTQARERRIREIEGQITSQNNRLESIKKKKKTLETNQVALLKKDEALRFFFEHKSSDTLNNDWQKAEQEKNRTESKLKEKKDAQAKLTKEIDQIGKPYYAQVANLKVKKADAERDLEQLRGNIAQLNSSIEAATKAIAELSGKLCQMQSILGDDFETLFKECRELKALPDDIFSSTQQRRISAMDKILADESPARIAVFQAVSPEDEVSCVSLWPVLKGILRDRVPSDVLDNISDDMIDNMRRSRAHLGSQLDSYKQDVKIKAKDVYQALRSEIRSKQHQIRKLSKLGESLQFGNITGVRIHVTIKNDMLAILENCADQMHMFSKESWTIEETLAEYFKKQMDLKMEGQDLLDYRTYMDIMLEVKRNNKEWERATSLSGGESIGCGLAIGLMLIRSLAARAREVQVREDQITPLFIIDEVHRLDALGQKTIIEFGKKEGFQVVVTAAALEPEYTCTLYALTRERESSEHILIRHVRRKMPSPMKESA